MAASGSYKTIVCRRRSSIGRSVRLRSPAGTARPFLTSLELSFRAAARLVSDNAAPQPNRTFHSGHRYSARGRRSMESNSPPAKELGDQLSSSFVLSSKGTDMKNLAMVALGVALIATSTAYAQSGSGVSRTGSSINSSGTGGVPGAGASSLNTSSDNNGGGSNAPSKSVPVPPNGSGASTSQGSAAPNAGSPAPGQKQE